MPSTSPSANAGMKPACHRAAAVLVTVMLAACATLTGKDPGARSPGVIMDDRGIESAARRALGSAGEALGGSAIGVDSFNGVVLLTGQVADESHKREAQRIVEPLRRVRRIHNEIVVGPADTLVSRANDRLLETRARGALVGSEAVNADRVKIIVRNGEVFLMGLVHREMGDAAAEVASRAHGVQRVVKVFEYVEPVAEGEEDEAK